MAPFFSRGWKVDQGSTIENSDLAKHDSKRRPAEARIDRESWWTWRHRRFSVIGWRYVVLMIIIFSLSSAWGLLLIVLNLAPDASANYILQAKSLDHGHFWQSRKTRFSIRIVTTALQAVIVVVYWYLLYSLLLRPPQHPRCKLQTILTEKDSQRTSSTLRSRVRKITRMALNVFFGGYSPGSKYRKEWNIFMEVPEVVLQILTLREHMAQGLDFSLLYCYASLMAINAFVVFYLMQFRWNEAAYLHALKDSILDAFCAVFFPALILFYSFFVFNEDLKPVKIRQQYFPPRIFERKARNYVSAKELNRFSTTFESLMIHSGWDIFLKLSFSLLACLRWTRITFILLKQEQLFSYVSTLKTAANDSTKVRKRFDKFVAPLDDEVAIARIRKSSTQPERSLLRSVIGLVFVAYGIGCIAYTLCAVRQSLASCSTYPQCVQFSYQCIFAEPNEKCHCLAYIDRDLAPADTEVFTDVTQTLANLSAAGKLQSVQLVNRNINGSLPDELATCHDLRHLVLIHTGVSIFPSWSSTTFSNLEYLHIEGDSSEINLTELPSDLFHLMTHLHTIYLSYHAYLPSLPSMVGLESLESVYLGYLDSITNLSSMGNLPAIEILALEGLSRVRALPDVEQYQDTLKLLFVQNSPACCSGFLSGGGCNTTFSSCCGLFHSNENDSLPASCLSVPADNALLPTPTTLSVLSRFASNPSDFCDPAQATCLNKHMLKSIRMSEEVCAGVLYRKCTLEQGGIGICFNENMGRVRCLHSQTTIDMRKAEIEAGVTCDQKEEKWLGCG